MLNNCLDLISTDGDIQLVGTCMKSSAQRAVDVNNTGLLVLI